MPLYLMQNIIVSIKCDVCKHHFQVICFLSGPEQLFSVIYTCRIMKQYHWDSFKWISYTIMCEQNNLQSLTARVATDIAKTVEKLFPAVGEGLVSIYVMCTENKLSCLLNLHGQIKIIFYEKHVNFHFLFSHVCTHSCTYFGCQWTWLCVVVRL